MKQMIGIFATTIAALLLAACNSGHDVNFQLNGLTSDGKQKLYVAIYSGTISPFTLIETQVATPAASSTSSSSTTTTTTTTTTGSSAPTVLINVPSGINLMFLFAQTDENGAVSATGVAGPYTIYTDSKKYPISVTLSTISLSLSSTIDTSTGTSLPVLTWSGVSGATKFEIQKGNAAGGPYSKVISIYAPITMDIRNFDEKYYTVRAYFSQFELYSADSNEVQHKLLLQ